MNYKIIVKNTASILIFAVLLTILTIFSSTPVYAANSSSTAGTVTLTSGSLNVRSAASVSSSRVTALANGSYVTLLSKSGTWWYVEYGDGLYGYCSASYITQLSGSYAATIATSSGSLNVRYGAGTSYSIKASLPKGETVVVISVSGNWSRILYNGISTGYVYNTYLSKGTSSSTGAYSAISLKVPYYYQLDTRWKNVTLGSSGKTIGAIGCATTALAMTESYRTSSSIYPSNLAATLSYTSGGGVYWPSNYTAITNSSGYLTAIYNQLKSGKPVLLGCTTSSGSQHWVVVTGYTGGSTLTASGFTINDPGTSSRTTLNQFLAVYPNFYKIEYYV